MFKKDFVWGVATSTYQVEGAYNEDGKGLSVWDTFCEQAGRVYGEHNGNIACDHYHRYKEDVQLIKELGVKSYRLSISWTRILPNGIGEVNQKGIDFYNNLIDELLANGIEPYITLFHWDYPQALHNKGAWLNPDSPLWFAEYAKIVAENFSDRVKYYFTFNEPQCFIGLGYVNGEHAPGLKCSTRDVVLMSHNVLKAHGMAVIALRENSSQAIKIGYAPTGSFAYPSDEKNKADIDAARKVSFSFDEKSENWAWTIAWWSDPVFLGKYPKDALEILGKYLPENWQDDLKLINQPLDFIGQNVYNGFEVKALENGEIVDIDRYDGFPRTALGWSITPKAIKWAVKFLYERYNLPVYITENGLSCTDVISLDGRVHDPNRIDYLNRYLLALREAAEEGADIAGYFQWSLMDVFEWQYGYRERFGLVYVDYPTQRRIIKDSGYWYKKVIEANGENL